jgi:hypothetical protein
MKTVSVIGILLSILGIIMCFEIINTHIDFYHSIINYLGDDHNLIRKKISELGTEHLDFGTKICFGLMGIFIFFLLMSVKLNRYKN